MAKRKSTLDLAPLETVFRFYGVYNNIKIGPNVCLNGAKVILHEVRANNIDDAFEFYKLHLMTNCGVKEDDIQQYLIDLYYQKIGVEIIDTKTIRHTEIPLISK